MAAEYNFNLPLDLSKLQNERMKLVPFDVRTYFHSPLGLSRPSYLLCSHVHLILASPTFD